MKNAVLARMEAPVGGSITVYNGGGYVAKFEVQYTLSGKRFKESSGNYTLGEKKALPIPAGATDVYLEVEEYVFIGVTTTIFTKNYPGPVTECFKIWGTTFSPHWEQTGC